MEEEAKTVGTPPLLNDFEVTRKPAIGLSTVADGGFACS
jgi:hypothetical protein